MQIKKSDAMDVRAKAMSDEPRIDGIRFVIDRSTRTPQLTEAQIRAIGLTLFLQESTHADSLWGKYARIESLGRNE